MPTTPSLAQRKLALTIIWAAMMVAIGVYWFVKVIVSSSLGPPDGGGGTFVPLLVMLSAVTYGAAWWWFNGAIGHVARRLTPTVMGQLSDAEREALRKRLQADVIACLALLETPVIFGLVSAFLRNPEPLFECAAVASLVGMTWLRLTGFPKVFDLLDRLESTSVQVR